MKADKENFRSSGNIRITSLSWERIFLNMEIEYDAAAGTPEISLMKAGFARRDLDGGAVDGIISGSIEETVRIIPSEPAENGSEKLRFHINMASVSGGDFLNNGRWYITAGKDDQGVIRLCTMSPETARRLADLDKVYEYRRAYFFYIVHFYALSIDSVNIVPEMDSFFSSVNNKWRERYDPSLKPTIKGKLKLGLKNLRMKFMQLAYDIFAGMHKNTGRSILFMSETKPYLSGNLKYIDERIKARGLDREYNISYSLRLAVGNSPGTPGWFRTIRKLAQQDFIFVDDYLPVFSFIRLKPDTKLIQLWHAGEGFKSVGYSRFGSLNSPHPYSHCHKTYTYAVTGSERLVDVYSEVFGIPRERILPLGMARLDSFLDEDTVSKATDTFYNEHPGCRDKKLILFCPTYRGGEQKNAYYDYDRLDLKRIYEFCGDEYIWAFKMHPFVKDGPSVPDEYSDRIIDLSTSKDINDLYYVTDIMITDYSSAYYEYALLKRPVLFYTYDRDVYELTRGVHKPILETAPGKVCDTFEDLMSALQNKDYDIEKTITFHEENFGEYDGKAADRIIDTIILDQQL